MVRNKPVVRILNILKRSSVLPSILEIEEELTACEDRALKLAGERLIEARKQGEKLIEETAKELPEIEKGNRQRLLDLVDARVEELKREEEREIRELEECINRNRQRALDFIINKIIPQQ